MAFATKKCLVRHVAEARVSQPHCWDRGRSDLRREFSRRRAGGLGLLFIVTFRADGLSLQVILSQGDLLSHRALDFGSSLRVADVAGHQALGTPWFAAGA